MGMGLSHSNQRRRKNAGRNLVAEDTPNHAAPSQVAAMPMRKHMTEKKYEYKPKCRGCPYKGNCIPSICDEGEYDD